MRNVRRQNFTHVFLDLSLPRIDGKIVYALYTHPRKPNPA